MMLELVRNDPKIVDVASALADDVIGGNVYASAGYGRAAASGEGEWLVVVADGWRLPFVLTGPPGAREAVSPYGYGGLRIDDRIDDAQAEELWSATRQLLADRGVVSLFLRFPPFAPEQAERARALPGLEVEQISDTVLIPARSEEEMLAGLASSARRQVRKAERAGLTADVERFDGTDPATADVFRRLYDATMDRLDAPARLRFDAEYYSELAEGLHEHLLVVTVRDGEEPVSTCLLMDDGDVLHYHLVGSAPAGSNLGANNLLVWTAMRAAKARGLRALHMGGGMSPGDSLFRFKATFGGDTVPFHVGRAVIDHDRYATLVQQRADELGTTPEALERTGYFPAFRATPAEEATA